MYNEKVKKYEKVKKINIQVESELSTTRNTYDFISIAIKISFVEVDVEESCLFLKLFFDSSPRRSLREEWL